MILALRFKLRKTDYFIQKSSATNISEIVRRTKVNLVTDVVLNGIHELLRIYPVAAHF